MSVSIYLKRSATDSKRPATSLTVGELAINYDSNTPGLFFANSAAGIVKVGPAEVSATAPNSSPAGSTGNSKGEFWFDTVNSELKIWDGATWQTTGGGAGGGDYVPIGHTSFFAASTAPVGWIFANGDAVSRTTYAQLFAVIGTTYGAGDGSTTFNLPDLRGQFLRGWNNTALGIDPSRVFGSSQLDAFKSHCHTCGAVNCGLVVQAGTSYGGFTNVSFTGSEGGSETRPVNIAMLPCIKYQYTGPAPTAFTGKGAIIAGTGVGTSNSLPVGANDQVLTADSSCSTGLKWAIPAEGIPKSTLTAKGALITAVTASNPTALPVGMDGQVLAADSDAATGLKWAAAGKVLQVVQTSTTTQVTVASSTYTDTTLTATITPTRSDSKILVIINQRFQLYRGGEEIGGGIRLLRDASVIYTPSSDTIGPVDIFSYAGNVPAMAMESTFPLTYLDTPVTTSPITYKTQARPHKTDLGGQMKLQPTLAVTPARSFITLMEIAA